jgi:hypothetical protein
MIVERDPGPGIGALRETQFLHEQAEATGGHARAGFATVCQIIGVESRLSHLEEAQQGNERQSAIVSNQLINITKDLAELKGRMFAERLDGFQSHVAELQAKMSVIQEEVRAMRHDGGDHRSGMEISELRRESERRLEEMRAEVASIVRGSAALEGSMDALRTELTAVTEGLARELSDGKSDLAELKAVCDGDRSNWRKELSTVKFDWESSLGDLKRGMGLVPFSVSAAAEYEPNLTEWFGAPRALRLLYSAEQAQYSHETWHAAVDTHAPTLTVIYLSWKGAQCAIGGFTTLPWSSAGGFKADPSGKAAVFALKNYRGDAPYVLPAVTGAKVVYHAADHGPAFYSTFWDGPVGIAGAPPVCWAKAPGSDYWKTRQGRRAERGLVEDADLKGGRLLRIETWHW